MRKFTGEELSQEDVVALLKAALMAPTSKRSNSWQFIAVDDKKLLSELVTLQRTGFGLYCRRGIGHCRYWPIPWRAMYGLRTLPLPLL